MFFVGNQSDGNTNNRPNLNLEKDYSGAKFFFTEPIFLNKAHSTK